MTFWEKGECITATVGYNSNSRFEKWFDFETFFLFSQKWEIMNNIGASVSFCMSLFWKWVWRFLREPQEPKEKWFIETIWMPLGNWGHFLYLKKKNFSSYYFIERFACRRCCLVLRLRQGNIAYTLLAAFFYIISLKLKVNCYLTFIFYMLKSYFKNGVFWL